MIKLSPLILTLLALTFNQCSVTKESTPVSKPETVPYHLTLEKLKHECFTIGYDLAKRHAAYVTYVITPKSLNGEAKRKNNFKPDPLLPEQFSAQDEDYYKSGFDRGHLCPAADMKDSQNCMDKSFYYSNMSPQVAGFNRGVWKKLEAQVREWCLESDSIRVYTGPIFSKSDTTLGPNKVIVPQRYYKTVLRYKKSNKGMIGFVLNNESSTNDLSTFVYSIDSIENLINLDLYSSLTNEDEADLEHSVSQTTWFE